MRYLVPLFLLVGCSESDSCTGDVQWGLFSVDTFTPYCDGDALEIRAFDETSFLVDVNVQFRGIEGAGAVAGAWSLEFDGVVSHQESRAEVPSFDTETGWWRLHVMHWLSQEDASAVAALDGSEAVMTASFTDAAGELTSSSVEMVTSAP
ncbi:MAG: hypothetical protein KC912_12135 [Proteobacteria bacterium]|nr:hypothetical protein [Pseudomonadota bacterium]